VHPHLVVSALMEAGKLPPGWWETYQRLQHDYGASLPKLQRPSKRLALVAGRQRAKKGRRKDAPSTDIKSAT